MRTQHGILLATSRSLRLRSVHINTNCTHCTHLLTPAFEFLRSSLFLSLLFMIRSMLHSDLILISYIIFSSYFYFDYYLLIQVRGVARIFFRGGGTPRPLKGYHAPPAGGPGAKAHPRAVAKFHFFKRFKVLENESSFQKYQNFSCPKNPFFLRQNSKNWTYLTGIYEFFRKIIWKFSNFMKPINPEKFSVNSLIWLRNLQWRRKEFFRGNARAT